MPSNPKRTPPRGRAAAPPSPERRKESLPFDDELTPLRADDPRPQRVPQYPAGVRKPVRRQEEAVPTSVYDVERDLEFQQSFDPAELSDGGHKPAFVYVERGPGAGQLVPVKQGPLVIGRASVSDLRLQHPSISRRHAQLTRVGERFYVKDLGSQNGTFVNRARVLTEIEIFPGDQIAVGNALLKLRGPNQPAHPEPTKGGQKRKKKKSGSMVKLAIFAGAVGFGLAGVLTFAFFKLPAQPSFESLEAERISASLKKLEQLRGSPARTAVSTEAEPWVQVESTVVKPAEPRRADETESAAPRAEAKVEAKPETKPDLEADAKVVPKPEPKGEPRTEPKKEAATKASDAKSDRDSATAVAAARGKKSRSAPGKAGEKDDAESADEAFAAAPSKGRKEALARYEAGDAAAALAAAKRADDKDLVAKLTRFQAAYEAGHAAMKSNQAGPAVKGFEEALSLDEQLSSGWSKYAIEIRKNLAYIYTRAGLHYVENDEEDAAKEAFERALKYDPQNQDAKKWLAKVTGAEQKATPKRAIDDAWEDDEETPTKAAATKKPAKTQKTSARASAIDEAWED